MGVSHTLFVLFSVLYILPTLWKKPKSHKITKTTFEVFVSFEKHCNEWTKHMILIHFCVLIFIRLAISDKKNHHSCVHTTTCSIFFKICFAKEMYTLWPLTFFRRFCKTFWLFLGLLCNHLLERLKSTLSLARFIKRARERPILCFAILIYFLICYYRRVSCSYYCSSVQSCMKDRLITDPRSTERGIWTTYKNKISPKRLLKKDLKTNETGFWHL